MPNRRNYHHKCDKCGCYFYSLHKKTRYCSKRCMGDAMFRSVNLICEYCGKTFQAIPSEDWRKYCNRECYNAAHKLKYHREIGDAILTIDKALLFSYNETRCKGCNKILQNDEEYCSDCFPKVRKDNE